MGGEKEKLLIDEILSDARKRAERVVRDAKRRAAAILEQARSRAETEKREIIERAEREAEQEYNKIVAAVEVERGRRELRMKEDVIQEAFRRAEARISSLDAARYAELVVALSLPAIRLVAAEEMRVVVGSRHHRVDLGRLGEEIHARLLQQHGGDCRLELEEDGGFVGVKVYSGDGVLCFDNSIDGRRKRLKALLRDRAARELFSEEQQQAAEK